MRKAYTNSLRLAEVNELNSVAFPTISTGIYGYPKALAVKEVKAAIENYFSGSSNINEVLFVCFDEENYKLYQQEFR